MHDDRNGGTVPLSPREVESLESVIEALETHAFRLEGSHLAALWQDLAGELRCWLRDVAPEQAVIMAMRVHNDARWS